MLPFEVARGLKHCLSFGIRIRVTGTSPNDGLSEFEMLARGLRLQEEITRAYGSFGVKARS